MKILRGSRGAGGGGGGTDALTVGPAINMGLTSQYFSATPYLNTFKNLYTDWNDNAGGVNNTRDIYEQIATLSAGQSMTKSVWAQKDAYVSSNIRNGNYTIKWGGTTGSDITISVAGSGVSGGTRVDANTYTFDFSWTSGDSNPRVTVTNNRGDSNFQVTDIRCVYTPYLSLHETNGEIFCPDWLACMPTNIIAIRTMGPMQIWGSGATDISHIRPFGADAWSAFLEDFNIDVRYLTGMPYEVAARLAKKLSCDIICPFPLAGDQTCYNGIAARLYTELSATPSRHVILAVGNENWNTFISGATSGQSYLTTFGNAQSPAISAPAAEAVKLLMCLKACLLAGFPRAQIVMTPELQLYGSWSSVFSGYGALMMQYVDTGYVSLGATFGSLVDRVHTAPYQHINDGVTFPGAMYHHKLLNLDWANMTDANILSYLANDNTEIAGQIATRVSELSVCTGRSIPIGCYEWGQEVSIIFSNLSGIFYQFHVDSLNNKIVFESDYTAASWTEGDAWQHQNTFVPPAGNNSNWTGPNPGTCASTIAHGGTAYIRRVDGTSARFYTSQALAVASYANDAAASAAAIALDQPFSGQKYTAYNSTRWIDMVVRYTTFLDSQGGADAYTAFKAATIGTGKLSYPCQYHDVGGYPDGQFSFWWGLKKGKLASDTPRFLYYKGLLRS